MEIAAGKELPGPFVGMARGRPDATPGWTLCFIRPTVIGVDHERAAESREKVRNILDPLSDEMGDGTVTFDPAGDADQPAGDHCFAEGFVDFLPDDDVCCAGLVFQRQENDARSCPGALAGDVKTGDGDPASRTGKAIMRQALLKAGPQQFQRVRAQGKAQRQVILITSWPSVICGRMTVGSMLPSPSGPNNGRGEGAFKALAAHSASRRVRPRAAKALASASRSSVVGCTPARRHRLSTSG